MRHRTRVTLERVIPSPRNGGVRYVRFTPADYRHRDLAAQLVDSLEAVAKIQHFSANTTGLYAVSIRSLLDYLEVNSQNTALSLSTQSRDLSDYLYAWRDHLKVLHRVGSGVPRKYAVAIYKLVRSSESVGVTVAAETLTHAQARFIASSAEEADRPLTEFSNAERILLRDTSRQMLRNLDKRLAVWSAVLRSPNVEDGDLLAKALRDLVETKFRRVDVSKLIKANDIPPWIDSRPKPGRTGPGNWWGRVVLSLVAPTPDEYTAFRILMLLEKGWAPEELTELRMDELNLSDTGVTYTRHKARSHRRLNQFVESADSSRWGFNALIKRLIETTEMVRGFADANAANRLWIAPALRGYGVAIRVIDFHDARFLFSEWVNQHQLDLSRPYDPRRLRKTHKTIRALREGTLSGAAGDDHSVAVYARHYLPGNALTTMAAATVRNVQKAVVGPLPQFAEVYPYKASEVARDPNFSKQIRSLADKENRATEADRTMLPVTCRDEFSPPGAHPGGLCSSMVTACMTCTNAVVFEDHIPRLVHLESIWLAHRERLPPNQFDRSYGQPLAAVQAALAKMPATLVQTCRDQKATPLELPISVRAAGAS